MFRVRCAVPLVFLLTVGCDNEGKSNFIIPGSDIDLSDTNLPETVSGLDTVPGPDAVTGNPWNAAGKTMPATLKNPAGDEVSSVDEIHIFGVPPAGSPCPTPLGTLTVTNNSAAPATVTPLTKDVVAIDFKPPGAQTVAAGATLVIDIEFNCGAVDDIDTTLEVTIDNGTENNNFSTPLKLDVQGAP